MLLAAAMMLDHVGRAGQATRLRAAIDATLKTDVVRTRDFGGTASTKDYTAALIKRVKATA
jgi:isocitrate dehydrogenase (NAD+)